MATQTGGHHLVLDSASSLSHSRYGLHIYLQPHSRHSASITWRQAHPPFFLWSPSAIYYLSAMILFSLFQQLKLLFLLHNQKTAGTCFSYFIWNILSKTSSASLYKCEKTCWYLLQNISKPFMLTPQSDNMNMRSFPRSLCHSKMCFSSFVVRSSTWMKHLWICKEKCKNQTKSCLRFLDFLSSVLCCWDVRSAMVVWPNKTCYNGVLGQQTQLMVHCSKDLKHISVLQLNWSIHRNTAERAYWCVPRRGGGGGGVKKAVYLHTSSSPAVTPLTIWIIPDKPLFEITGLQVKVGHPCKNKQIHGSLKKSIFLSSLPGSWKGSFFSWDPPVELKNENQFVEAFLSRLKLLLWVTL